MPGRVCAGRGLLDSHRVTFDTLDIFSKMPVVPPGSPTLKRLKTEGRWDETTQSVRAPLGILDLPEDVIGFIVQHMDYAALVRWMMVCRVIHKHCWSTWRGQALLLRTASFGTAENFKAVFANHVTRRGLPIEPGINIVYNYCMARTSSQISVLGTLSGITELLGTNHAEEAYDRIDRVRVAMLNAKEVYSQMAISGPGGGIERVLSTIYMPVHVEFLRERIGLTFKEVLVRLLNGWCVPWGPKDEYRYRMGQGHFIDGKSHPTKHNSSTSVPTDQVAAAPDPANVQAQAANLFAPNIN